MTTPIIHPATFIISLLLGSLLFSALGIIFAGLLEPVSAVAALNALRFTLLFLGGAVIPKILLPHTLRLIAESLPLLYVVEGFRYGLYNMVEVGTPYIDLIALASYTFFITAIGYTAIRKRLEEG